MDQVKAELTAYLSRKGKIDYITFSGAGEPTLNEGIGDIIEFLKSDHPQYKIALLTNSTLFDQEAVRRQILPVDVVMASLDAASKEQFKRVNRPHPNLDLDAIVEGIAAFRKMYRGRLIMECFLVKGCNDTTAELTRLKTVLTRIGADGIVLNTLDRRGTEAWVQPVKSKRLKNISDFFEGAEIVKYEATPSATTMGHADLMERLVRPFKGARVPHGTSQGSWGLISKRYNRLWTNWLLPTNWSSNAWNGASFTWLNQVSVLITAFPNRCNPAAAARFRS